MIRVKIGYVTVEYDMGDVEISVPIAPETFRESSQRDIKALIREHCTSELIKLTHEFAPDIQLHDIELIDDNAR